MFSRPNFTGMVRYSAWKFAVPAAFIGLAFTLMPAAHRLKASARALPKLPMLFIENRGQLGQDVSFYTQGSNMTMSFSSRGVTFSYGDVPKEPLKPGDDPRPGNGVPLERPRAEVPHRVELDFVGARPDAAPVGQMPQSTRVSNFTGSQENWRTGLRTYGEIAYENLWPGIDLVYSGAAGRLKYQFEVSPGADPQQIRLAYKGGGTLRIGRGGGLEEATGGNVFRDEKPIVWQEANGKRVPVSSAYVLTGDEAFGFALGSYDRSQKLVIDPEIFGYATFIGSTASDRGLGLALDSQGRPVVTGRIRGAVTGTLDIYIGRLNSTGTAFDYFDVIGGTGDDEGFDIVTDSAGNAYATGYTDSPESSFPLTVGPDLTYNGGGDAFVVKVNPAGDTLLISGYVGGSNIDFGEGIAVDASFNITITGFTGSDQTTFPTVTGPDVTFNGSYDCFVARVKANPNSPTPVNNFLYSGYIGGTGDDVGITHGFATAGHLALDSTGNAYISGMTTSQQDTFPSGSGFGAIPGFDQTQNGGYDAFVVKVRADGTGLVYATFIGGRLADYGFGMAVDAAGNAYFTGYTNSSERTFPVRVGPDLTYNGRSDAIVGKLDPSGTNLVFLGYIGGSEVEAGNGLAIDSSQNVYVIGATSSPDFPVVDGPDLTFNGSGRNTGDAFVVKVNANPNSGTVTSNFSFSSFLGGTGNDWAFWVRVGILGDVWMIGDTESTEATFPNGTGFGSIPGLDQTYNGGGSDAFLVRLQSN